MKTPKRIILTKYLFVFIYYENVIHIKGIGLVNK